MSTVGKSFLVRDFIWPMDVTKISRFALADTIIFLVLWAPGKAVEKVPAALCRKVASAQDGTHVDIWGDGEQTRSFCSSRTVSKQQSE